MWGHFEGGLERSMFIRGCTYLPEALKTPQGKDVESRLQEARWRGVVFSGGIYCFLQWDYKVLIECCAEKGHERWG